MSGEPPLASTLPLVNSLTTSRRQSLLSHKEVYEVTEHDIQNLIRLKLSEMGCAVFRINSGKVRMADGRWFDSGVPKGFSDLIAVRDGRIYFLEVKTETGRPSEEQVRFLAAMRDRYGCVAEIVRSVEDAVRAVEGTGKTCSEG